MSGSRVWLLHWSVEIQLSNWTTELVKSVQIFYIYTEVHGDDKSRYKEAWFNIMLISSSFTLPVKCSFLSSLCCFLLFWSLMSCRRSLTAILLPVNLLWPYTEITSSLSSVVIEVILASHPDRYEVPVLICRVGRRKRSTQRPAFS